MGRRILIADKIHNSIFQPLRDLGYEVDYRPEATRDEIRKALETMTGLIIRSKTWVDEDLLSKASGLEFVGRAGAGMDQVDDAYLESRGIHLFNAAAGNRDAVAEHAMGMILALLNNFKKSQRQVGQKEWDREGNRGYELREMTAAILGYGNTGSALAQRLSGFGCKVIAHDKYKQFTSELAEQVELGDLFEQADLISVHVPLTAETEYLIDGPFLERFQKPVYVINTSRGSVLDWSIVKQLLDQGKLRGVALDVLPNEKPGTFTELEKTIFEELAADDRVILTPHVAGWTYESLIKINQCLVEEIRRLT